MKIPVRKFLSPAFFIVVFTFCLNSFAQVSEKTLIKGLVLDALTGYPIPYASVFLKGTSVGTLTDANGKYLLESGLRSDTISFSFIGYKSESRKIISGKEQTVDVSMDLTSISLDEVVVKAKKKEYKNKNNPAVELINRVVAKKDENRPEAYSYLEYKTYEKIQFAFSNVTENFKNSNVFSDFSFIFNNIDTTRRIGNDILPMFIKESLTAHYFRKEPEASKEVLLAEKSINLDEYLNNKGASAYLNYLYQNIDIYDNEILFLTNKFLSPIASTAPVFYRYYIIDTLPVADIKCIRLFFEPRNKSDFLFHGNLYITMDSSYAVKKIDIGINKAINIDWVQDISITQDFEKSGEKAWLLSKEEIAIDFGIVKNSMGLFGQRTISYKDYKINKPISDETFRGPARVEKINPASDQKSFWEENRYIPLSKSESQIYTTIDSLKQIPDFRRKMDAIMLITVGFLDLGKVEIGPVSSFYSYNSIEGSRYRFGGRTTPDFSKKLNFDGYLAYGAKDDIFKYNAGITYSLTPRTIYQFLSSLSG
ncbi:MAG: carboxypeptidase-like regulatory domain-containing protein [Bacteroidales bacterium]|nr:carboxypeptidase-like regulatory domain-containing protein [Bacteroidales bacterium]